MLRLTVALLLLSLTAPGDASSPDPSVERAARRRRLQQVRT
jgi:hypothetical protein